MARTARTMCQPFFFNTEGIVACLAVVIFDATASLLHFEQIEVFKLQSRYGTGSPIFRV